MGTIFASWHNEAYLARAWALAKIHKSDGIPSAIVITALHLANRAPISKYSWSRSLKPSKPSVIFSPENPDKFLAPVSTFIPGITPLSCKTFTRGVFSLVSRY